MWPVSASEVLDSRLLIDLLTYETKPSGSEAASIVQDLDQREVNLRVG